MRILITEGTDKATALAALRIATAAVEKHFSSAVLLPNDGLIHLDAPDPSCVVGVEAALTAAQSAIDQVRDSIKALEPSPSTIVVKKASHVIEKSAAKPDVKRRKRQAAKV